MDFLLQQVHLNVQGTGRCQIMRINNNLAAINTHRQMGINAVQGSKSIEKLSSGSRINRAGDDAAGLSISEKMRGQIRGLNQASRNSQDAVSLIQTFEGAAGETHSILQRMRELAVQAASDTNTSEDRIVLNEETTQLLKEVDRIANNTEFNTMKALNYGASDPFHSLIAQIDAKVPGWINDSMVAINARFGVAHPDSPTQRSLVVEYVNDTIGTYAAAMSTADAGATLKLTINLDNVAPGGVPLSDDVLDGLLAHEIMHAYEYTEMANLLGGGVSNADGWFMEGLSMLTQGGNDFITDPTSIITADNATVNLGAAFPNTISGYASAYVALKTLHEITVGGINAIIDQLETGVSLDTAMLNTTQQNQGEVGAGVSSNYTTFAAFIADFNANNFDAYLTASTDFTTGTGAIETGAIAGSSSNFDLASTIANGTGTTLVYTHFTLTKDSSSIAVTASEAPEKFYFQIGSNSGQNMELTTRNMTSLGLGVASVNLTTRGYAGSAIKTLDDAIESVSSARSYFGAVQNRIEHTIRNVDTSAENLQASESRIRDVDMAREMMHFTKSNILQQASQAMLSQANQAPQSILQLLRS